MKPKWQKLANLAQEICTSFSPLMQSLLPRDILLRTYLHYVKFQPVNVIVLVNVCQHIFLTLRN